MQFDRHPETDWVVACKQLFDSALPTGAYAHSFGLEGMVQAGYISDSAGFVQFLEEMLSDSLVRTDLPVFREAYKCLEREAYSEITKLDELATALRPTRELRKAGAGTGRQTWRLYDNLLGKDSPGYPRFIRCSEFLVHHQSVVVLAILASILGIPLREAMLAYVQQVLANFCQCCIKLLGFGPTEVQRILFQAGKNVPSWIDASMEISLDETGSMAPCWDIASSQHAFAGHRLFIS